VAQAERIVQLARQIEAAEAQVQALGTIPASTRQAGPYSQFNRLKKQIVGWRGQVEECCMRC
jgi:hypothetical protein